MHHLDEVYVHYIVNGSRIGFDYTSHSYQIARCNMLPKPYGSGWVLSKRRGAWLSGWPLGDGIVTSSDKPLWGHTQVAPARQPEANRQPVLPRGGQCQWWHSAWTLLPIMHFNWRAVTSILQSVRGLMLEKLVLESAYRIVPVHPDNQPLLRMEWKGYWYVDATLPFGLWSATKIFMALADGLLWIMGCNRTIWMTTFSSASQSHTSVLRLSVWHCPYVNVQECQCRPRRLKVRQPACLSYEFYLIQATVYKKERECRTPYCPIQTHFEEC